MSLHNPPLLQARCCPPRRLPTFLREIQCRLRGTGLTGLSPHALRWHFRSSCALCSMSQCDPSHRRTLADAIIFFHLEKKVGKFAGCAGASSCKNYSHCLKNTTIWSQSGALPTDEVVSRIKLPNINSFKLTEWSSQVFISRLNTWERIQLSKISLQINLRNAVI